MRQVANTIWLVVAAVALLFVLLVTVNRGSLGWFSSSCRQMAALQEVYTFPNADASEPERLADRMTTGDYERVFQPEQMDASTRHQYGQAVADCKQQTRAPAPVFAFADR